VTAVEVAVEFSGRYTVMFVGQLIVGGVLSITVMVCESLAEFPEPSVAV
jgi:hypothetical protein